MKIRFTFLFIAVIIWAGSAKASVVPKLNSYPSASAVIYLDFDGHTVTGTAWNYAGPIVCAPAGLNNSAITNIFDRVAEDYRPFNINITTDSTVFLNAPLNQRMRVILTVTSSWYGSAGGVSFVGSFSWGDDTPCFVFTQLLSNNIKKISEATSHEVGHTLGLFHQSAYDINCNKTSEYNPGTGSGEIAWAPIMGVSYSRNFTLWHNGSSSTGCADTQSDLDIITGSANGFGYRPDDYGNSFSSATSTPFVTGEFLIDGVIEQTTDVDFFTFTLPVPGRFQLNAIPYNVGTNNSGSDLDMQIKLIDSNHVTIGVYNPGTLLNSVVDSMLLAGKYYLQVDGIGNIYASDYGSLGSYSLQGLYEAATVLPVRKLNLTGRAEDQQHLLSWDIQADEILTRLELEMSVDSRRFTTLHPCQPGEKEWGWSPVDYGGLQYRLHAWFNDGHDYYSNIVTLPSVNTATRPALLSNLIRGTQLTIRSPGEFEYEIVNLNGKLIRHGRLLRGTNLVEGITENGFYLIRYGKDHQTWSEKFLKQ